MNVFVDSLLGVEQYSRDVRSQDAEDKDQEIYESGENEESFDEDDNEEEIDSGSDLQSEGAFHFVVKIETVIKFNVQTFN